MWGIDAFSDPNTTAKEMGEKVWKSSEGMFEKHVKLPDYVSMGNLSEGTGNYVGSGYRLLNQHPRDGTPAIVTNAAKWR